MKLPMILKAGRSGASAGRVRRVTLADVAERAGVSRVAVCEVLNNRPNCWASEVTRKRIRDAADALGYRPNLAARALRSGKTRVIGLISPGFGIGSPHSRAGGLTESAATADYTVTLCSHPNNPESEDKIIRRLLDRGMDGLAIYPVDPGPHTELRRLVGAGFPVVTFDGANLLDFACDDVSVDIASVGRLQVRHLLEQGRRRLCLANTVPEARLNAIREAAIRDELKRAGAAAPLEMRLNRPAAREFGEADAVESQIRDFLAENRGAVDGIIGFDAMASLSIRVLRRLEVRVPADVSVVGAGDSTLASYGMMPMTSVSTVDDEAGARAFQVLLDRIEGRDTGPFRRLTSPAKLIIRESTGG